MRVKVVYRSNRGKYVLRWKEAGRFRERMTDCDRGAKGYRKALRLAAQFESTLPPDTVTDTDWEDFLSLYRQEHLDSHSKAYAATFASALRSYEDCCSPKRLGEVSKERILVWQQLLRKEGKAASTIRAYSKHLLAALSWAESRDLIKKKPRGVIPPGRETMRGRPLRPREFVRMLKVARKRPSGDMWVTYLKGLWWSGLRLSESLVLSWDSDGEITVDLNRDFPVFVFFKQKSGHERTTPIAPEFVSFLRQQEQRTGFVFQLPMRNPDNVGKAISAIGREAGIAVSRTKFASAHDIRRSFGSRWARVLMPADLMKLMRHESISTTMNFYVDIANDDLGRLLWSTNRGDRI